MRPHRLTRLALLTQGAALVGLGLSGLACSNDPPPVSPSNEPHVNSPPEPPKHVNAPDSPPPTVNAPPSPSASASTSPLPVAAPNPPHVNAPKPPDRPKKP